MLFVRASVCDDGASVLLTWIEKEKSLARRGFGDSVRWIGDCISWHASVDGGGGALGEELTDWTGVW